MLERNYQARVIRELKWRFKGCIVLKNDSGYLQGFPDLTILYKRMWAVLEVKTSEEAPYRPNQEYYLQRCGEMSFSATIFPENEEEILRELEKAFALFGGE